MTSFEYRLHPVGTIYAGPILYPLEKAREAMRLYRDVMAKAPDDLNAFFAFLDRAPRPPFPEALHNKTLCGVVVCYTGPTEKAEEAFAPSGASVRPSWTSSAPCPSRPLQGMFDGLVPAGLQNYWKADFVNELTDDMIEVHVKHGPGIPTFNSALHIYPVSGAADRVGRDDTAFSYRDAKFVHVIAAMYPDPADTPRRTWPGCATTGPRSHPHSSGGAYVNFLMEEGQDRVRRPTGTTTTGWPR